MADPDAERQDGAAAFPPSVLLLAPLLQMMAAKTLYAAAELGIADLLATGPRSTGELAERTGTDAPSLRRLLHALTGQGILTETGTGTDRYALTESGQPLRTDAPDSIRSTLLMACGPETSRSWDRLVPSLRTGTPGWDLAHGMSWTEYYARNPGRAAIFNRSQAEHTRDAAPGILAAADFGRFREVADIGGGDGTLLTHILRAHDDLRGVLFDVRTGLAGADATLAAAGVGERCRVVAGDFFGEVPDGADAYLLKEILHDWDDEQSMAILRSVRAAIPPGGRLLLVERTLPDRPVAGFDETHWYLRDLLMLVVTGGRERTENEFRLLLKSAGFNADRFSDPFPPFGYRLIEALPA
ncbi:methyltransferase [Actinomadura sp. KC216]|uniref:methyltransferase n=1 Tax=Actinomadura sp. KC216 TaxID=2530370 RepID=UPI00104601D3|nr:methyltransferase [Actinomadura sp. KC216]TDB83930.1 methyltransferase [Actinomadura sp. KC216]